MFLVILADDTYKMPNKKAKNLIIFHRVCLGFPKDCCAGNLASLVMQVSNCSAAVSSYTVTTPRTSLRYMIKEHIEPSTP